MAGHRVNTQPGGTDDAVADLSAQVRVITEQLKQVPDHETRIRALEQFRWKLAGVSSAAGGFVGYLIALISHVR